MSDLKTPDESTGNTVQPLLGVEIITDGTLDSVLRPVRLSAALASMSPASAPRDSRHIDPASVSKTECCGAPPGAPAHHQVIKQIPPETRASGKKGVVPEDTSRGGGAVGAGEHRVPEGVTEGITAPEECSEYIEWVRMVS